MQQPVPGIPPEAVAADAYVLDVREPDEWQAGHIRGAHHVPLASLPTRLAEVPADREVVVACRTGGRSARATAFLRGAGRAVVNLEGGTEAWAAAGRPLDSETGQPPLVLH